MAKLRDTYVKHRVVNEKSALEACILGESSVISITLSPKMCAVLIEPSMSCSTVPQYYSLDQRHSEAINNASSEFGTF